MIVIIIGQSSNLAHFILFCINHLKANSEGQVAVKQIKPHTDADQLQGELAFTEFISVKAHLTNRRWMKLKDHCLTLSKEEEID
jgi:ABC-type histidine transport system ATPase subunit